MGKTSEGTSAENAPHHNIEDTIQKITQELLTLCERVKVSYENAEAKSRRNPPELPSDKWKKDREDLHEILHLGKDIGGLIVTSVLTPSTQPGTPQLVADAAHGAEKVVWEKIYKKSSGNLDGERWSDTVWPVFRALGGVARAIPDEMVDNVCQM